MKKHHNQTHGMTKTKTWKTWKSMRERCKPNAKGLNLKNYYSKGITVCERWDGSFEKFYEDMGDRPNGFSIDRIDNTGNYEPNNCRWANRYTQCANKSNNRKVIYRGKEYILSALAREFSVARKTLYYRIFDKKWSVEDAVEKPTNYRRRTE